MDPVDRDRLDEWNVRALCGLVWMAVLRPCADDHAPTIASIVRRALVRVPGQGRASMRLASAATAALLDLGGPRSRAESAALAASATSKRIVARLLKGLATTSP